MKSIILFLSLAIASGVVAQTPAIKTPPTVLKSDTGRFVFGQIGEMRADQFMLDTETGRIWQVVVDKDGRKKLQPVPYVQIMGDEAYIPDPAEETERHRLFVRQQTAEQFRKLQDDATKEKK